MDPRIAARRGRVARAQQMRAQGMAPFAVARELGVALSTVHEYLGDPDGTKRRRRKAGERRRAGQQTRAMVLPEIRRRQVRSVDARLMMHRWDREQIIAALQRWTAAHGRPPCADDWTQTGGLDHPAAHTVGEHFEGGFTEALRAARLGPHDPAQRELWEQIVALVRNGATVKEAARQTGVRAAAIRAHLKELGSPTRKLQEQQLADSKQRWGLMTGIVKPRG